MKKINDFSDLNSKLENNIAGSRVLFDVYKNLVSEKIEKLNESEEKDELTALFGKINKYDIKVLAERNNLAHSHYYDANATMKCPTPRIF